MPAPLGPAWLPGTDRRTAPPLGSLHPHRVHRQSQALLSPRRAATAMERREVEDGVDMWDPHVIKPVSDCLDPFGLF